MHVSYLTETTCSTDRTDPDGSDSLFAKEHVRDHHATHDIRLPRDVGAGNGRSNRGAFTSRRSDTPAGAGHIHQAHRADLPALVRQLPPARARSRRCRSSPTSERVRGRGRSSRRRRCRLTTRSGCRRGSSRRTSGSRSSRTIRRCPTSRDRADCEVGGQRGARAAIRPTCRRSPGRRRVDHRHARSDRLVAEDDAAGRGAGLLWPHRSCSDGSDRGSVHQGGGVPGTAARHGRRGAQGRRPELLRRAPRGHRGDGRRRRGGRRGGPGVRDVNGGEPHGRPLQRRLGARAERDDLSGRARRQARRGLGAELRPPHALGRHRSRRSRSTSPSSSIRRATCPKYTNAGSFNSLTYDLDIPGNKETVVEALYPMARAGLVLGFEPHLHSSGRRMCVEALLPERLPGNAQLRRVQPQLGEGLPLRGRCGAAPAQGNGHQGHGVVRQHDGEPPRRRPAELEGVGQPLDRRHAVPALAGRSG